MAFRLAESCVLLLLNLHEGCRCILTFLEDFHSAGFCHRDIRLDNVIRCSDTYVVIDLELAARADQPVFWRSDALPFDVAARSRVYGQLDDLWQLGKLIRRVELAVAEDAVASQIRHLASRLVQRDVPSARAALEALQHL